ncbi:MAG: hypothetical protein WA002_09095, partial [Candidatus Acidiferrales bacterium]
GHLSNDSGNGCGLFIELRKAIRAFLLRIIDADFQTLPSHLLGAYCCGADFKLRFKTNGAASTAAACVVSLDDCVHDRLRNGE